MDGQWMEKGKSVKHSGFIVHSFWDDCHSFEGSVGFAGGSGGKKPGG